MLNRNKKNRDKKLFLIKVEIIKSMVDNNYFKEECDLLEAFIEKGNIYINDKETIGTINYKGNRISLALVLDFNFFIIYLVNHTLKETKSVYYDGQKIANKCLIIDEKKDNSKSSNYLNFNNLDQIIYDDYNKKEMLDHIGYYTKINENKTNYYYYEEDLVLVISDCSVENEETITSFSKTFTITDQQRNSFHISEKDAYDFINGKETLHELVDKIKVEEKQKVLCK